MSFLLDNIILQKLLKIKLTQKHVAHKLIEMTIFRFFLCVLYFIT